MQTLKKNLLAVLNYKNIKNNTTKNNSHFSKSGPKDLYVFTNSAYRHKMSALKNTKKTADDPQTNPPQTPNQTASQTTFFSSPLAYLTGKMTNPSKPISTTLTTNPSTEYAKYFISINIKDPSKLTFTVTFLIPNFVANISLL